MNLIGYSDFFVKTTIPQINKNTHFGTNTSKLYIYIYQYILLYIYLSNNVKSLKITSIILELSHPALLQNNNRRALQERRWRIHPIFSPIKEEMRDWIGEDGGVRVQQKRWDTYTQKVLFLRDEEEMLLGWQQRNDGATLELSQKKHKRSVMEDKHGHVHTYAVTFMRNRLVWHEGWLMMVS